MLAVFGLPGYVEVILLAGMILGMVVVAVVLVVALSRINKPPAPNPNLRPCPDCGRLVSIRAKSCPQCGCLLQ